MGAQYTWQHSVCQRGRKQLSVAFDKEVRDRSFGDAAIFVEKKDFIEATLARETAQLLRYSNREVVAALAVAGGINLAMVVVAASAFHPAHAGVAGIESAYVTLVPLFGGAAAAVFLVGLIASGLSSSVVGTMAGQVVLQGFLRAHVPVWVRRLVTMVPAFVVIGAGVDVTRALVISQVVLSMVVPFPMAALIWLTCRADVMGPHAVGRGVMLLAALGTVLVTALNTVLVADLL